MSRRGKYDKSAPSRRPGSLAHELVVLAARVRGVVLFALERVDDLIVVVARQLDDNARRRRRLPGVRRFNQPHDVEPDGLAQALLRLCGLACVDSIASMAWAPEI